MKQFNLAEYLANPSRKIVTRDGDEVRILCTDRKSVSLENLETKPLPIVALVFEKDIKLEGLSCYYEDGRLSANQETSYDLFFAPIKKEGWINIYKSNSRRERIAGDVFPSEKEAKEGKTIGYITTIKIEWEE